MTTIRFILFFTLSLPLIYTPQYADAALPAKEFTSKRGLRGWLFDLPGEAVPPAVNDKDVVFTSGGKGSHKVYALKAKTGKVVWEHTSADDGPTSPVATEEHVAFTTYSCTVDVLDAETGEARWSRWLAPTLYGMPTLGPNTIYVSYAFKERGGPTKYCIHALDVNNGNNVWKSTVDGEVLSAPILDGHSLYATTTKGTLYRFNALSGTQHWQYSGGVIAAPSIDEKRVIITQNGHIREKIGFGNTANYTLSHVQIINWLDSESGEPAFNIDPGSGFDYANQGLGIRMRLFNFSGARPTKAANLIVSPSPSGLIAVDDTSGEVAWCTEMETTSYTRHNSLAVSPAAFAGGHFFTGTKDGRLLCVSPQTGEVVWEERVNGPIKHEPVVAKGRIYVCSGRKLYCFDTEDPKIDGWPMWGGAITRNK